jgi:hypothetical protein
VAKRGSGLSRLVRRKWKHTPKLPGVRPAPGTVSVEHEPATGPQPELHSDMQPHPKTERSAKRRPNLPKIRAHPLTLHTPQTCELARARVCCAIPCKIHHNGMLHSSPVRRHVDRQNHADRQTRTHIHPHTSTATRHEAHVCTYAQSRISTHPPTHTHVDAKGWPHVAIVIVWNVPTVILSSNSGG